jgi:ribosomal protein S18 acetylase RimI-like enzyme
MLICITARRSDCIIKFVPESPTHFYLTRTTSNLTSDGEFQPIGTAKELAPLMLAAYRDTPDYEGEDLAETELVLTKMMAGVLCDCGDPACTFRSQETPWLPAASFIALDKGVPVGAIMVNDGAKRPLISLLFTHPDFTGQGIATNLIARAAEALAAAGYPSLGLVVSAKNQRAHRLYQHLGFN